MNKRKAKKVLFVDSVYAAIYLLLVAWILLNQEAFLGKLAWPTKIAVVAVPAFLFAMSIRGIRTAIRVLRNREGNS